MSDTSTSAPRPASTSWRIVLMLMIFAALGHLNREGMAIPGNKIFIKQLGLTKDQMGWVYSSLLIAYTIGMLPCGWLIDRIGSARTLTLFGITMGSFVMLTGVIGWLTTDPFQIWVMLLVVRSLAGFGCSPLHPGAAHMASEFVESRHRPIANGLRTAGALVGIAFSYPILGWILDRVSWPWMFICSGGALFIYALIWGGITHSATPTVTHHHTTEDAANSSRWQLFADGRLLWLTLSYFAFGYFQYLFFYWMQYYFLEVLMVEETESRAAAFWINISQGVGMALGGVATSQACSAYGTTWGRRLTVMSGMGMGAAFALAAVNSSDFVRVTFCFAASMAALGLCEGVFWTTATDIGGRWRGFSGAFMNTGGNVGGWISPVLTPFLADSLGWPRAIAVGGLICILGGAIWFLIDKPDQPTLTTATSS